MKLGTGERVIEPYQAGQALAGTIGALPVPLSGPPLPSPSPSSVSLGSDDARELTAAYVRGLQAGSALEPMSPSPAGQPAQAPDLQKIVSALPGLTKPGMGRAATIFALTGLVAGAVIRSVGERHGNDALRRAANAIDDLAALPSALLTPDGQIIQSVAAGANLTCDLLALATHPPCSAEGEGPGAELIAELARRADGFEEAIGFATQFLSPGP